jgi:hypothetical protein
MALLSPDRFTIGPTGTRKVPLGHFVLGAVVKTASPAVLNAQLPNAGDQRCGQA